MDRIRAWWSRRALWQKVLIVAVALVLLVGPFVGNSDDTATSDTAAAPVVEGSSTTLQADESTERPETSEPASTAPLTDTATEPSETANQASPAPGAEEASPIPDYTIVEEEDVSFAGAVRISLRVAVEEGADQDALGAIAKQLADEYRETHQYQSFNIFFYHYPELANDIVTLGSWDDSPYGDWGRAAEAQPGDYSTHEPNDATKQKNWSLLPTPEQVSLYLAYGDTFDAMDTDPLELPSDDDVFAAVATDRGVDAQAVESAVSAVLEWIFNDTA